MLIITGITIAIVILSLTTSYAWYTFSGGATDFESITSDVDLNVIYAQSQIITTTTSIPINDKDIDKYADSNIFTVSSPTDLYDYQILLTISLTNIKIDDELITEDFKYQLLQDDQVIKSGTGKDFTNNTLVLKDNIEINPVKTYTFKLVIWLSDTGLNQNDLMNKTFQATIQTDSVAKK